MEFPKLSKIDKAFLIVLVGVLSVGLMIQAGSSFSGTPGTFGVDPTGEKYIEVDDLNVSRDWFRGLVNVTDNVLGVLYDLIPDTPNTYDIGSAASEWHDVYVGTGKIWFYTDQGEYIYSDGGSVIFGAGGFNEAAISAVSFSPTTAEGSSLGNAALEWANLYLGTGKAYFYLDQDEYVYSEGSALIFGVAGSNVAFVSSSAFRPSTANVQILGGSSNEWNSLYIGTGFVYFWTDQAERIGGDGNNLIFTVAGAGKYVMSPTELRSTSALANTQNLGTTFAEWANLYLGTGRIWLYTDQNEWLYSTGTGVQIGVGGSNRAGFSASAIFPITADALTLGATTHEFSDLYLGTGRAYFFTDQGESIYSNGTYLKIDGSAGILPDGGNNTGAIGADSERWANGWFTTITAKSSVTGNVIETEIAPAPWESFEAGDVVKIYDSEYFVKTSKKLDYVVGVVVENPEMIIDHYDYSFERIPENITHTETSWTLISREVEVQLIVEVEYVRNITDAFNNTFEVIERRNETVVEDYLERVEYELLDGSSVFTYKNSSRIVMINETVYDNVTINTEIIEIIYHNVTTETPIFMAEGSPVLCVAGVAPVKIIEPVFKNDILVAGPNGVARPFRVVIEEIKANYGGVPFNWDNVLTVLENFNMRTLGQVMEDSNGDYAQVMLW